MQSPTSFHTDTSKLYAELASYKSVNVKLIEQLKSISTQNVDLTEKLAAVERENAALTARNVQCEEARANFQTNCGYFQQQCEESQRANSQLQADVQSLLAQLDAARHSEQSKIAEVAALKQENAHLKMAAEANSDTIVQLTNELSHKTETIDLQAKAISVHQATVQDLLRQSHATERDRHLTAENRTLKASLDVLISVVRQLSEVDGNEVLEALQLARNGQRTLASDDFNLLIRRATDLKQQVSTLEEIVKQMTQEADRASNTNNHAAGASSAAQRKRRNKDLHLTVSDFQIDDTVMFYEIDTARNVWYGNCRNQVRYYLSDTSVQALKNRRHAKPFIYGKIVFMERQYASRTLNPFNLVPGAEYWLVDIEPVLTL